MHPEHNLDGRCDLTIAALFVLGLGLTILSAAAFLRLSADWSATCRGLLHVPAPLGFAAPWRLAPPLHETRCLARP